MIPKTLFLAKIIHRIGTRNLRGKKSLHENLGDKRGELPMLPYFGGWEAAERGEVAAWR
jgi:hypothetical protein